MTISSFKDHFSRSAKEYASFRPHYPPELFAWLAARAPGHAMAWDAGTGNGQAAVALAEHFDRVLATDASAQQLTQATPHARVEYRVTAERCELPPASVDLVAVAQALHWLDRPTFWAEARRVLRPGGVVAAWCYEMHRVFPEIDAVVERFYRETVGPYWTPDRKLVEDRYRGIEFPFDEIVAPAFAMKADWTVEQELGYMGTWSAVNRMRQETGRDPVEEVRPALESVWPPGRRLRVEWPIAMRVGHVA